MLKRIGICLITILCATSVFAQSRRKTRSTTTQTQPGYYFTINTCNACCYDWHGSAVKLFKAAGIRAVVVFGQERKNSNTQAFSPLHSFEKFFFKDVTRDSEICAQGTLYVGPFASKDTAISALEKFPAILFSVIKNRGADDMYSEAELRNLERAKVTQNGTSNNWRFGGDSFFSINGYQIVQSSDSRKDLANKSWQAFWAKFSNAIYKKDFKTLIQLSSADAEFFDGGGGGTSQDWFNMMSSEWGLVKKAVTSGVGKIETFEGQISRSTTKHIPMIFSFEKDNKWRFSGVTGD
ncbi:MAG TPA: hypothetical protein VF543_03150 [Pyrinomonadaceae bacterium]|jgi:hypothetical protein